MVNLIKGVDISSMQGTVNFQSLVEAGIQFVICRCGVGNNGVDGNYASNIAAATAAGLKVAAYHFVFPLPTTLAEPSRAPAAQAAAHAAAAGSVPVVCCDLEWPIQGDWAKWGCSASQIVEWVTEYLQAYEKITGIRPIVYTYPNFAQSINYQLPLLPHINYGLPVMKVLQLFQHHGMIMFYGKILVLAHCLMELR